MHSGFVRLCRRTSLLALFLAGSCSIYGQSKIIRLRNETIITEQTRATPTQAEAKAVSKATSGLLLIQLGGPLQTGWGEALSRRGIELLRYVPEDAFVARARNVRISELRSLPFVHWVGDFRPEHKLHAALPKLAGSRPANGIGVSLLLAPDATPDERLNLRRLLLRAQPEARSRFGSILRGHIEPAQLKNLSESDLVVWIEPGPQMKLFDEISSKIVAGGDVTGLPDNHATIMQQLGFDGRDVTVAVADSGLDTGEEAGMHPDLAGRAAAFFHYGALTDAADEHSHGTHVTGIIAGDGITGEVDELGALYGLGVAPRASIIAQRIFDGEGNYEAPPTFETLTRDAVQAGAVIGSNSWGDDTQGRYDLSAAEFDALVRDADHLTPGDQPYILEFSAGNAGPGARTIGSPAVAKNVIATGASQNERYDFFIYAEGRDAMADFSSRGPCEDGRIKPDVVAPGTWIASLRSTFANDDFAWADISHRYLYQGGTSQAGPQVSGAAAVFVQYYRQTHTNSTPSPALVKAALINSAVDMDDEVETGPSPNMDEGWGRVDLTGLIGSPVVSDFLDQTVALATGQQFEHRLIVISGDEPLRITLAYTDVPGFPAAIPALVNDLDLEVIAPDGEIYRGNQFDLGESVPDAPAADNINNVEGIYISEPSPGEYVIRIRAANVPQDARTDTLPIDQDFALVASGDIPLPGVGSVLLDRTAYTVPSRINIKVVDPDLVGQQAVSVSLTSSTEANGLTVTLRPSGIPGVFTGSVATATGPASSDLLLQIANGDTIEAAYFDASAGSLNKAMAVGDLTPPAIANVSFVQEFGQVFVRWTTIEPASSIVQYGTNTNLGLGRTNRALVTDHFIELTNVLVGPTYFFAITSADAAGNRTTDNNNGAFYSFVASASATVLLVDAYIEDTESPLIPLSTYTNTLNQIGVSYDVWSIPDRPNRDSPLLANLRPYPIVMWRINDSIWRSDTLNPAQQTAIQQYLSSGGAFFMSSMELLSRLGNVPFRSNVLQVASFAGNTNPFEQCDDCDEDFGVPAIEGVEGDLIGSGILVDLDYSDYPEIDFLGLGPDFSDTFTPGTNASPILLELDSGKTVGIRFPRIGLDDVGRVVFLSFPLDTVPTDTPAPGNRVTLLRNILQFLAPGLHGVGSIAFERGVFSVPDQIIIEVADSDLAGAGEISVAVFSDSAPQRVLITLQETVRPGLFRGFVPLIAINDPPAAGKLRAKQGDAIHAEYLDASSGETRVATAEIDTELPLISNIGAVANYEDAIVTWETSEETDGLVQFGESILLGRTAYRPDFEMAHELTLSGLAPDRSYYYQVVSRDAAGNTTVDNNGGQFYTLQTLRPLRPPIFDNFENSGTNWSVFNGEDSQASWTNGVPRNGVETEAHSPATAWGSNIAGDSIDYADTFLISPAIDLSGGNQATLRFWHSYDFSERGELDLLETGTMLIVTNSVAQPVSLAEYGEVSDGWEEEQIDLTPYIGRVVYLVWHYQQFSFDAVSRPGWLVDDVSITITNVIPGTIRITNNLSQALFTLRGPLNQSGAGYLLALTNAPPGEYAITFGPVPFYETPPSQTNLLASLATIVFQGNYTFPNANANRISDLWEQQYFGTAGPGRTDATDTDGDGASDYAEFVAGTNPTNSTARLRLLPPTLPARERIRFDWAASPGRSYRIEASVDLLTWSPLTEWLRATGSALTTTLAETGVARFYRLVVLP